VTLIELLISLLILAVVMAAAGAAMSGAFSRTRSNRSRAVAANLASQQMDQVRQQAVHDFSQLSDGHTDTVINVDTVPYNIGQDNEWITQNATSGPCDGPSNGSRLAFLRITLSITWPNMAGVPPVTSETLLTPPVGSYQLNTGHIGVKVRDRNALPEVGQLVTLSGLSSDTATTTADGCAFFPFLAPGNYTVSLNTPTFVNGQGLPNPASSVSVVAGSISSVAFDYDQASTLSLTFSTDPGAVVPAAVAVSLGNTHLLPSGLKVFPGSGPTRTIGSLFPYLDGYDDWAGDCLDADPEARNGLGAIYPGGQRQDSLSVSPGTTTPGQVVMKSVQVTVKHLNGSPVPGAVVVAKHNADTGCPAGETLTVGPADATGKVLAALPYGAWTIQSGAIPIGSWPSVVVDPTKANPSATVTIP
jgi:type II secretory pathway pseudopilin PulG